MISRKNLDELIEGYTDARNRVSSIGYDLDDLSTLASPHTQFARTSALIASEISELYSLITMALNMLNGVKPAD